MPDPHIRPSRRTIVRGAAWTAPMVVAATAAPAFAASATCQPGCPNGSFNGGYQLNGWVGGGTDNFATGADQRTRFQASYTPWNGGNSQCNSARGGPGTPLTNVIIAEADPSSATPTPFITYDKWFCMMAGINYTFTFNFTYHGPNNRAAYLDAQLLDPNGAAVASAAQVIAPAASANGSGSRSLAYRPTVDTWYRFSYRWTFAATPAFDTPCNRYANDIAVTAPTVQCSAVPPGG